MIAGNLDPDGDTARATFSISGPEYDGTRIGVVGDFNHSNLTATVLTKKNSGTHTFTVALQAGLRYRLSYLTDERQWFDVENADEYETNEFDRKNGALDLTTVMGPGAR